MSPCLKESKVLCLLLRQIQLGPNTIHHQEKKQNQTKTKKTPPTTKKEFRRNLGKLEHDLW